MVDQLSGYNVASYVQTLLSGKTATGAGQGFAVNNTNRTFHAKGTTSSGSGVVSVAVQGSNTDIDADYITMGTISLTLGTTSTSDGFTSSAPWKFVRGNVTFISGTGAVVTLTMGV